MIYEYVFCKLQAVPHVYFGQFKSSKSSTVVPYKKLKETLSLNSLIEKRMLYFVKHDLKGVLKCIG